MIMIFIVYVRTPPGEAYIFCLGLYSRGAELWYICVSGNGPYFLSLSRRTSHRVCGPPQPHYLALRMSRQRPTIYHQWFPLFVVLRLAGRRPRFRDDLLANSTRQFCLQTRNCDATISRWATHVHPRLYLAVYILQVALGPGDRARGDTVGKENVVDGSKPQLRHINALAFGPMLSHRRTLPRNSGQAALSRFRADHLPKPQYCAIERTGQDLLSPSLPLFRSGLGKPPHRPRASLTMAEGVYYM